ncbi:alkaline phosphatase, partial [Salmonella enterica subsp. enterica serovar Typhimurium]
EGFFAMLRIWDVFYWIDFIGLIWLVRRTLKMNEEQPRTKKPFYKRYAFAGTLSGIALLFGNLMIAEADRPQLLTRTFDRNYIVN